MQENHHESLLGLWERISDCREPEALLDMLEAGASELLETNCRLQLACSALGSSGRLSLEISREDGQVLGSLELSSPLRREHGSLASLLLKMLAWALERRGLLRAARERAELLQEMRVGRRVVEEALPEPRLTAHRWELEARLEPVNHLGGDLFAYSLMPGYVRFLLADAVGHGLGSTLLASECRSLWHALAGESSLAEVAANLSRMICESTGDTRFVAAHLGRCYADGTIEFVACGQGPGFRLEPAGWRLLEETEPPLGVFFDQSFAVQRLHLASGDMLVLSTDGLVECESAGRQFGVEGVRTSLERSRACRPGPLLDEVFREVERYQGAGTFRDDRCALAIQRL